MHYQRPFPIPYGLKCFSAIKQIDYEFEICIIVDEGIAIKLSCIEIESEESNGFSINLLFIQNLI